MHAFRMIMPIATIALAATGALCGCGEEKPAAAPTETTGASVEATRNQLAQVERERNEARAALATEQANKEKEHQAMAAEMNMRKERDNLENRIFVVLEKSDQDMQMMREKAIKSNTKTRKDMEQSLLDAQSKKSKLYADLRRINGEIGQPWDSFKAEVESTMTDLSRDLSAPSDMTNQPMNKAKGGTMDTTKKGGTTTTPDQTKKTPADQKQKPMDQKQMDQKQMDQKQMNQKQMDQKQMDQKQMNQNQKNQMNQGTGQKPQTPPPPPPTTPGDPMNNP